ncbi:MAG: NAD(P)-dependent oxidoreductase [Bacteroidales bacterium]|nr:NAD(P)-dependent oxidoreductase [Bacteroidales bacterium]
MQIALTGGTGFIGSYIAKALSDSNHNVTILARNSNKVPNLKTLKGVSIVACPLEDKHMFATHLKGCEILIHVAVGFRETETEILQHDTLPSIALFEAAAKAGVKKIIYTSSTSVVDYLYMTANGKYEYAGKTIDENHCPMPTTPYGAAKAANEQYLQSFSYTYPVQIAIVRPGYIFGNPVVDGAYPQPDTHFATIAKQALNGEDIIVEKNGGTQFLWAGYLTEVYKKLLSENHNREVFYALGANYFSWADIATIAVEALNSKSKIIITDNHESIEPYLFSVEKMKNKLNLHFTENRKKLSEHFVYLANTGK